VCVNLRIAALFSGIPGKILGYPHAFYFQWFAIINQRPTHASLFVLLARLLQAMIRCPPGSLGTLRVGENTV